MQAEDRPILRDTRGFSTNSASGNLGTTGFAELLATNQALCAADANCTYVRHDSAYKNIEPHWRKVFIGSMVLNTTQCPAIAWLDSDSVLGGKPSDLLALLRPHPRSGGGGGIFSSGGAPEVDDRRYVWPRGSWKPDGSSRPGEHFHMVASGEGDLYNHNLSPFNAGVWVVANTKLGRAIMSKWVSVYHEHASRHWAYSYAEAQTLWRSCASAFAPRVCTCTMCSVCGCLHAPCARCSLRSLLPALAAPCARCSDCSTLLRPLVSKDVTWLDGTRGRMTSHGAVLKRTSVRRAPARRGRATSRRSTMSR